MKYEPRQVHTSSFIVHSLQFKKKPLQTVRRKGPITKQNKLWEKFLNRGWVVSCAANLCYEF